MSDRARPWGAHDDAAVELGRNPDSAILPSMGASPARLNLYDELRGLPTRRLLMDRLEHDFAARGRRVDVSLLSIGLDSLRAINDTLGHDQGDAVLSHIADRLCAVTRPHVSAVTR